MEARNAKKAIPFRNSSVSFLVNNTTGQLEKQSEIQADISMWSNVILRLKPVACFNDGIFNFWTMTFTGYKIYAVGLMCILSLKLLSLYLFYKWEN